MARSADIRALLDAAPPARRAILLRYIRQELAWMKAGKRRKGKGKAARARP